MAKRRISYRRTTSQECGYRDTVADETACVSLPSIIKGHAPKGKTPVMEHTAKRFKINILTFAPKPKYLLSDIL